MSNKMNRAKALVLTFVVAASGLVLTLPAFADDNSCTQTCEQVFQQAQNLPSPNAESIKDYLNRVTDAGMQCLQCASDQIQGQPATDDNQSNGSSSSSSADGQDGN